VLHGFVAAVLVQRAVIVVMMRFVLQMHGGMRSASGVLVCGT
jgi:hypothetical protein